MPRRRVFPEGTDRKTWPPAAPEGAPRTERASAPRQPVNIDDLVASPWVGLHYRHEFLLHHRHELLEQHKD